MPPHVGVNISTNELYKGIQGATFLRVHGEGTSKTRVYPGDKKKSDRGVDDTPPPPESYFRFSFPSVTPLPYGRTLPRPGPFLSQISTGDGEAEDEQPPSRNFFCTRCTYL